MIHGTILRKLGIICLILCLTGFAFSVFNPVQYDILIKGAKIIDGTGNPWFYGDIGIKGDMIAAIGDLSKETAAKTINAKGLVVAPGFIDMHNHADYTLGATSSNVNLNYLTQGVTTVVTGNCGGCVSLKVANTKAKWEKQGIGTNAVYLVGLGSVRRAVMGVEPREATDDEVEKMKETLRQSMREGAWGVSTGLEYIPGLYSTTEEVIELTKVVAEFNGVYASHMRNENEGIVEAIKETIRIGEETGVPVNISHLKVTGKNNWGLMKDAVQEVNEARARGVNITADQYPYVQSAPFGPIYTFLEIPPDMKPLADLRGQLNRIYLGGDVGEKLVAQYLDELKKALSDKSKREQIRKSVLEGEPHKPSSVALAGWDSYLITVAKKNTHLIGKILSDIAKEQKRDPFDVAADLVIDEPDLYVACGVMSEDDMKYAIKQDWLMFSSDGSAAPIIKETDKSRIGHPRAFGSQTIVLRKYVREDKVLTLESAIRKMTSLPASFLQVKDRGLLVKGYKADIVIFDPKTVRDNSTPSNTRQYSTGTKYVIVNGNISIENGEYNGALNGKLLLLTENK